MLVGARTSRRQEHGLKKTPSMHGVINACTVCSILFLIADPQARWLTVGDGRYGNDAKYISNKGGHALASDISDCLLKEAKDIGYIAEYKKENAEALSFQDAEFDYVLAEHVKCGREEFAMNGCGFILRLTSALRKNNANVLLLSGVIQFLPKPYEFLVNVLKHAFPRVIVDRTAFFAEDRDLLTVLHAPEWINRFTYPTWFLQAAEFALQLSTEARLKGQESL
jgi:hypothetical protein